MIFQLLAAMLPALTSAGATAAGTAAAAAPAALGTAATAAAPAMASAAAPTALAGLNSAVFGSGAAAAPSMMPAAASAVPSMASAAAPAAGGMWDTLKGMIGKDGSMQQGMDALGKGAALANMGKGGGVQPSPIAPSSGVQMGNNQIVRPDVAQRPDMLRARMAQRNPLEFLLNNRG